MIEIQNIYDELEDIIQFDDRLLKIHHQLKKLICEFPASINYHHYWKGGYITHVLEVCKECNNLLQVHNSVNKNELLMCAYLHDIDKLCRYKKKKYEQEKASKSQLGYLTGLLEYDPKKLNLNLTKGLASNLIDSLIRKDKYFIIDKYEYNDDKYRVDESALVVTLSARYGIELTNEQLNAISLHHGGWSDLANKHNVTMSPMATLLHCADLISTKIYGNNVPDWIKITF